MPRKPRAPKQNGHVRVLSDGSPEGTRLSVNGFIINGVQSIDFHASPDGVECMVRLVVKDVDLTSWPPGITVVHEPPSGTFHAIPSPMDPPVHVRDIVAETRKMVDEATAHERRMYPERMIFPEAPVPWDDPKADPIGDIERAKRLYAERAGASFDSVRESFTHVSKAADRASKSAAELLREARERRDAEHEARIEGLRKR